MQVEFLVDRRLCAFPLSRSPHAPGISQGCCLGYTDRKPAGTNVDSCLASSAAESLPSIAQGI